MLLDIDPHFNVIHHESDVSSFTCIKGFSVHHQNRGKFKLHKNKSDGTISIPIDE